MNNNGFRYPETMRPGLHRRKVEHKAFSVEISIDSKDIFRIVTVSGGVVITCFVIVCSYLAGMMLGVLFIIGVIVFMVVIFRCT